MTDQTIVLVTGSNRGIGKGLVTALVSRPKHTIIAGVRDPTHASSLALHDLPHGDSSSIILVAIDSSDSSSALAAMTQLQSHSTQHNIPHLNLVIANAGISKYFGPALDTPPEEMIDHFTVNAVAPLLLFQAVAPLLKRCPADKTPKFVTMSSGAGSIGGIVNLPVQNTAYGASKAAANFVTRRIHYENREWLCAFSVNPGWLQTDLGSHAATNAGLKEAPVSVQDGVAGVLAQIDGATREKTSGTFTSFNGDIIPW